MEEMTGCGYEGTGAGFSHEHDEGPCVAGLIRRMEARVDGRGLVSTVRICPACLGAGNRVSPTTIKSKGPHTS